MPPFPILIIGYGNELRGDDAAGPRVAEAVTAWNQPGIRVITVHQLTPELADPIAQAGGVFFVDAAADWPGRAPRWLRLEPTATPNLHTHLGHPAALLALAQAVFGRRPEAWWVTLPAQNFDFGAPLSDATQQAIAAALIELRQRLSIG